LLPFTAPLASPCGALCSSGLLGPIVGALCWTPWLNCWQFLPLLPCAAAAPHHEAHDVNAMTFGDGANSTHSLYGGLLGHERHGKDLVQDGWPGPEHGVGDDMAVLGGIIFQL